MNNFSFNHSGEEGLLSWVVVSSVNRHAENQKQDHPNALCSNLISQSLFSLFSNQLFSYLEKVEAFGHISLKEVDRAFGLTYFKSKRTGVFGHLASSKEKGCETSYLSSDVNIKSYFVSTVLRGCEF
jgi:hypothetical protein